MSLDIGIPVGGPFAVPDPQIELVLVDNVEGLNVPVGTQIAVIQGGNAVHEQGPVL
jgi:hypothetical protein